MADSPQVLILGGYGNTGRIIADLLLTFTDVSVTITGRNASKAEQYALELGRKFTPTRVTWKVADAADAISLDRVLLGVNLVIVASSTSSNTHNVARAVLRAECDYLDINYARAKLKILEDLRGEIETAGRCFVTDGGFHPGLPAAMIRAAAEQMDELIEAKVSSVISINWSKLFFSNETMLEFVQELADFSTKELINGEWQEAGWGKMVRHVDFGGKFGLRNVYPMWLEELSALPELIPSLKSSGFYVGGFNWFVDYFIMPLGWMWTRLAPIYGARPVSKMLVWGLKKFSTPPYGTVLHLQSSGISNGKKCNYELRIAHESGYYLTAAPVVACVIQLLKGADRKPGLWFQAHLMNPQQMLTDLKKMEIVIESHESDSI